MQQISPRPPCSIRPATPEDAPAILSVYAPFVLETSITFEYDVPSPEAFGERISGILNDYPYLVAETDGVVCGYAYASRHMARTAYDWDVQTSVYLAPEHHGRGIGRRLYACLFTLLREQGLCNAYAIITLPNEASLGIHAAFGFTPCGTHRRTGYKHGAWHDVAWMEKALAEPERPTGVIPFPSLDRGVVSRILRDEGGSR